MKRSCRIPKYRLHKPSGRAVVTLGGKTIYLGPHESKVSRLEYDRVVTEWLANNRQLPHGLGGDVSMSVAELIRAYWGYVQKRYVKNDRPTGEQAAVKAALRPVLKLYGHVDVSVFGANALVVCREEMVKQGWCRRTVNKQTGRVKRMFAWATERELVPDNLYHRLLVVTGLRRSGGVKESEGVSTVPNEHVEAVVPHISAQVAAMIRLQLESGMRPGEVVLMRPCDIDRSDDVWIYRPMRHKTEHHGHVRTVPLFGNAQEVLAPFLERRESEAFLFDPREAEVARAAKRGLTRKTRVTPSQARRRKKKQPRRTPQEHYTRDSYRRAVQRACEAAGVPKWSPNQLRHNAATRMQQEVGVEKTSVMLGHQSPVVTEVYVERDLEQTKQIARQLGQGVPPTW